MAINKKLIIFETKEQFTKQLSSIANTSIVFIKDAGELWTHGKLFAGKISSVDNKVTITLGGETVEISKYGHTHSYLPLSGGTLTGGLTINSTKTFPELSLHNAGYESTTQIGNGANQDTIIRNTYNGTSTDLRFNSSTIRYKNSEIFHKGNLSPVTTNTELTITKNKLFIYTSSEGNRYTRYSGNGIAMYCDTISWACGISYLDSLSVNSSGTTKAGIGALGTNKGAIIGLYMGVSSEPWSSSQGLFITTNNITFKNNKIWHAGNDGSGSGLDADTLDGQLGDWYRKNVLSFTKIVGDDTTEGYDVNTLPINGGIVKNYGSYSYWKNTPKGLGYGSVFTIHSNEYGSGSSSGVALDGQFAWDIEHNVTSSTKTLWFRAANNLGWQNDWKRIAFTTDNVESASRLQTPRTLWGQSFDGTANVSGNMTGVGRITFNSSDMYLTDPSNNNILTRLDGTLYLLANSGGKLYLGYRGTNYIDFYGGVTTASTVGTLLGRWNSTGLGIGTGSPLYKLDVTGAIRGTSDIIAGGNLLATSVYAKNGGYVYVDSGWVLVNKSGTGLYSSAHDARWYAISTGWKADKAITSSSTVTSTGFLKSGSSDSYVLLGGGGHRALSNFVGGNKTANHGTSTTSYTADTYSSTYVNKSLAAFAERGSWAYANNGYITTDFGSISLAGTAVFQWGASDTNKTLLFITPLDYYLAPSPLLGEMVFYSSNGDDYKKGWTRVLTNRNYLSIITSTLDGKYVNITGDTMSGALTISTGTFGGLLVLGRTSDNGSPSVAFKSSGITGYIGVGATGSSALGLPFFATVADSSLFYKIWHAGNDGSGSGLNADLLDGIHLSTKGNYFNKIPYIGTDGVIELGKYIDFHYTSTDSSDYSIRLTVPNVSRIGITLPSKSGTLALVGDVVSGAGYARKLYKIDGTSRTWTTSQSIVGNGIVGYTDTTTSGRWDSYGSILQFSNLDNPTPGSYSHWVTQLWSGTSNKLGVRWRTNEGSWSAMLTILTDSNYTSTLDGKYVNVTGDTMTGPLVISTGALNNAYNEGVRITAADNGWAGITFGSTGNSGAPTDGWFAARDPNNLFIISPGSSSKTIGLTLYSGAEMKWRNNTVWHAGNDGSGSGLDADLLDGKQGTYYAISTTAGNIDFNTITRSGIYRLGYTTTNGASNGPGGGHNWGLMLVMHGGEDTISQLSIAYGNSEIRVRSGNPSDVGGKGSWGSWVTYLNANNYSSYVKKIGTETVGGTLTPIYLNAGTPTACSVSSSATASTIAVRDSAGDIQCRLVRPNYANQTTISGAIAYRVNNSTDNYIRFCSDPAAVRTWLGAAASSHTHSYLPLAGGTMTGAINTYAPKGMWISGKTSLAIKYNSLAAIDSSSYWAFLGMKSASGNVLSFGGLGDSIGFYGYKAATTANQTDYSLACNTSNGVWNFSVTPTIGGKAIATQEYVTSLKPFIKITSTNFSKNNGDTVTSADSTALSLIYDAFNNSKGAYVLYGNDTAIVNSIRKDNGANQYIMTITSQTSDGCVILIASLSTNTWSVTYTSPEPYVMETNFSAILDGYVLTTNLKSDLESAASHLSAKKQVFARFDNTGSLLPVLVARYGTTYTVLILYGKGDIGIWRTTSSNTWKKFNISGSRKHIASFSGSGYVWEADGWLILWGYINTSSTNYNTVYFPLTFDFEPHVICSNRGEIGVMHAHVVSSANSSSFQIRGWSWSNNTTVYGPSRAEWFAIGLKNVTL